MRDRVEHGVGCAFQQVGEADVELSLAQADGVVDGDEGVEAEVDCGDGCVWTQASVGSVEDFGEARRHCEVRLA